MTINQWGFLGQRLPKQKVNNIHHYLESNYLHQSSLSLISAYLNNKPNTDGIRGSRIIKRVPSKILNESFYAELNNTDETVVAGAQCYPNIHRNIKNKI